MRKAAFSWDSKLILHGRILPVSVEQPLELFLSSMFDARCVGFTRSFTTGTCARLAHLDECAVTFASEVMGELAVGVTLGC